MLGLLGRNSALLFFGADLSLYLIVKILRGDFFWYRMPVGWKMEIISSLVKLIADFTSIAHFMHPYELGGAQWAFSVLLTNGKSSSCYNDVLDKR